jgi:YD repeat-containing protein
MPMRTMVRWLATAATLTGLITSSALFAQNDIQRYAQVLRAARIQAGAETVAYSYDPKGRLVRAVRSGVINDGVTSAYEFDRADNRTRLTTTGSTNPPQP